MRADRAAAARALTARHYAVIPLGPSSGLIQWVEGATPLFALYRASLQRAAAAAATPAPSAAGGVGGGGASVRPLDLYQGAVAAELRARGLSSTLSRREWPADVLQAAFTALVAQTPPDLVGRELLCGAVTASEWWQRVRRYARSAAVMSIVGYVIGLGDRHLDNILLDMGTGELVHIDFSAHLVLYLTTRSHTPVSDVCFEKGLRLRIPETVPFRWTPALQAALSPPAGEGLFTGAALEAMRVLRTRREALLTLLEAFAYDPLVDWAAQRCAAFLSALPSVCDITSGVVRRRMRDAVPMPQRRSVCLPCAGPNTRPPSALR
jgi:PI-3-kinase-related kinase SMG-1